MFLNGGEVTIPIGGANRLTLFAGEDDDEDSVTNNAVFVLEKEFSGNKTLSITATAKASIYDTYASSVSSLPNIKFGSTALSTRTCRYYLYNVSTKTYEYLGTIENGTTTTYSIPSGTYKLAVLLSANSHHANNGYTWYVDFNEISIK